MDCINKRLLAMKPPVNVTKPPRSITLLKYWKGFDTSCYSTVFLVWIVFYLDNTWNISYCLYRVCLLKDSVTSDVIALSELFYSEFVLRFEQLYGKCHVSYNVHIILHAPLSVQNLGPLWAQSAFVFESSNDFKNSFMASRVYQDKSWKCLQSTNTFQDY